MFQELRDRRGTARALGNLGQVSLARDALGRAKALFRESLALLREIGDRRGIALSMERLASTARADGQLQRAARLFGASDALHEAIGVVQAAAWSRSLRVWRGW